MPLVQVVKVSVVVQATDTLVDEVDDAAEAVSVPPCSKPAVQSAAPPVGDDAAEGTGVAPRSKSAVPAADPVSVGASSETPSRKQRIRMGRRLEGAIANRRADAKLPGAARLRRNWFFGVVSISD
jgi:hypothetical protein